MKSAAVRSLDLLARLRRDGRSHGTQAARLLDQLTKESGQLAADLERLADACPADDASYANARNGLLNMNLILKDVSFQTRVAARNFAQAMALLDRD